MSAIYDYYAEHLAELQDRHEQLMAAERLDALFIHAGTPLGVFRDDQAYPFRANPYFKAWLPLTEHPHGALLLRPGCTPRLYYHNPVDFWHEPAGAPEGEWVRHFEIRMVNSPDTSLRELTGVGRWGYLGPDSRLGERWGAAAVNPESLLNGLDYARARKTRYEQGCVGAANRLAVQGHRAAREAFEGGGAEFDIQQAYLVATRQREQQMPYGNIVALNAHAAVLHYQHYRSAVPAESHTLLIDAGAQVHGYAADITRTYSAADGEFRQLIQGVDQLQQALCAQVSAGASFIDLHQQCHAGTAALLQESGLVRLSVEEQLAHQVTSTFFPHGLGHLLGLQVHDAGGQMAGPEGGRIEPPRGYPSLRLTRALESGMVLTIEPGLYFIPSLLASLAASPVRQSVDWGLVDRLRPYGGIRIEDNLVVQAQGAINLTREAFAEGR